MDSGNSGSISSSGDEEYDSRTHHQTLVPSNFFHPQSNLQFNSISHNPQLFHLGSNSISNSNSVSFFDLSPNYLQNLSQSQPNIDTSSFPPSSQGLSSPSSLSFSLQQQQQHLNQCLLTTPQTLGLHDNNNARTTTPSPATTTTANNATRNSKKRTRASRRAPTTVLTTDTSNFRAMVQEFTGIPAPPFSGSSYSRRLDLLTSSSSLRSTHFDPTSTTSSFYPLRPSPQKLYHQNPLFLSSSSSSSHNNNMVDATVNNNYPQQQLPISDLGLPYNNHHQHQQQQHNFMLSMQNQQPIHTFNNLSASSSQQFHPFSLEAFGAKSQHQQQQQQQQSLSVQSLEDLGVNQGQVNAHLVGDKVVGSSSTGDGVGVGVGGGVGSNCKVNFSGSGSITLNHEKTMENNNNNDNSNNSNRGGEGVDSWICSSD
ncbi:uncharacterized protein LOC131617269 [Vicia villosa]|uniref:uncharacterized protein LOC131617269 n=1 Tax=Vicia villosa TaxID=3911 RepID=UPI00273BE3E9|nr:uncharacterized protein LOC131617269 [Vicia villosa]